MSTTPINADKLDISDPHALPMEAETTRVRRLTGIWRWLLIAAAVVSLFLCMNQQFTWRFFVGFNTPFLTFAPRVEPAFSMYLRLILALGITFQLPTLVLFLARMGMVSARFMIRNFKYAVILIVLAAAVLSPDGGGVGMFAMAGPVIVLYIGSIGLAWLFGKKRQPELAG